jgi:hypothetical protein
MKQHLATNADLVLYEAEIDHGFGFRAYRPGLLCLCTPWGLAYFATKGCSTFFSAMSCDEVSEAYTLHRVGADSPVFSDDFRFVVIGVLLGPEGELGHIDTTTSQCQFADMLTVKFLTFIWLRSTLREASSECFPTESCTYRCLVRFLKSPDSAKEISNKSGEFVFATTTYTV